MELRTPAGLLMLGVRSHLPVPPATRAVLVEPRHEAHGRAADGHRATPAVPNFGLGSVFHNQCDKLCDFSESVEKYHSEHY